MKELTLNEYQEKAMDTCMSSCDNFAYMALNKVGETGEFLGKIGKLIRKGHAYIDGNQIHFTKDVSEETILELKYELGDMMWHDAGLCKVFGWSFNEVAQLNLEKLRDRAKRGKIDGNGDHR